MVEISQVNRTDYALPNAADDTPRDEDILRHVRRGVVGRGKENFSIDLQRLEHLFSACSLQ